MSPTSRPGRRTVPAGARLGTVRLAGSVGLFGSVGLAGSATLVGLAALAVAEPVSVGPASGRAGDFPVFVWRASDAPGDALELERLRPFGGAQVNGGDSAEWLREQGLDTFVFNAPGRNVLHLDRDDPVYLKRWNSWYEGRDDVHLSRQPCLTEPTTRALLLELLGANLAAHEGRFGHGISLGDEVSLTPAGAPEDVCLSTTCRRAWVAFLAGRTELDLVEREALADPSRYSTDAARLALTEDDVSLLRGWLLRREFHQGVVVELLEELARASRARAPLAPVGLLGLSGQTAFGNVAVERALEFVDFIECYPVGNARELAHTLRPESVDSWATVFVEPKLPNRAGWEAWMHWIRGGDGLVVWSGRDLEQHPRAAERLAQTVADIRATEERLPDFRPLPRGVALVHSPRSVAISWLRDALLDGPTWPRRLPGYHAEHGTLERSQTAWLRFFEDQGMMPGAVPLERVGRGLVRRFPLLVLNHTLLIDGRELERLYEYLDAGGSLLLHGEVGWLDGRCRERSEPLLTELLAHSDRVLVAPDIVDEYPSTRTRLAAARREVLESRLWAYLPSIRARVDRAPFEVVGEHADELPWLSTWQRDREDGGWICAAIPNAVGEVERKRLEHEIPVTVKTTLDLDVEWIHPRPRKLLGGAPAQVVLAPGSAAVFRLVPRR